MADKKKSVWDIVLNVGGKDDGSTGKVLKKIESQIQDVKAKASDVSSNFKSFAGNLTKLAFGISGGVAAAFGGLTAMANSVADAGEEAQKMSERVGIGVENYQRLQYAMGQSNVTAEELSAGLRKYNNIVSQAAAGNESMTKKLDEVGLSAVKLSKLKPETAFLRLSDYMKSLPNDADRTRVAIELFGRQAGPGLMAAMKEGSDGIREMMALTDKLGTVIDEKGIQNLDEYGDQVSTFMDSLRGVKTQFVLGGVEALTEAYATLTDTVTSGIPSIKEMGKTFGEWLAETVKKLPAIISTFKRFVKTIVDGVIQIKDFVGGWENLGKILLGLAFAPTFLSSMKLIVSVGKLAGTVFGNLPKLLSIVPGSLSGIATAAAPVTLAIAGIGAAAVVIYRNFDELKEHVLKAFDGIFESVTGSGMGEWWQENGEKIKSVISSIGAIFERVFVGGIKVGLDAIAFSIKLIIRTFNILKNVFMAGAEIISGIINVLVALFQGDFDGAINAVKETFSKFGERWKAIFKDLRRIVDDFVKFVKDAFFGLVDALTKVGENIRNALGMGFTPGDESGMAGLTAEARARYQTGVAAGTLPKMAIGGIVNTPTIAQIGEKGREAVIPLNSSKRGFDLWKQAGTLGGYSGTGIKMPGISTPAAGNTISVDFKQNFTITGNPDEAQLNKIAESGKKAADDFESRLAAAMLRTRRLSYA